MKLLTQFELTLRDAMMSIADRISGHRFSGDEPDKEPRHDFEGNPSSVGGLTGV